MRFSCISAPQRKLTSTLTSILPSQTTSPPGRTASTVVRNAAALPAASITASAPRPPLSCLAAAATSSRLAFTPRVAVCDRWFASAPCQTWPNRWFVHAATADGYENNRPIHLPDVETIYNRFEQAGIRDWKIYFHDIAQAHTLLKLFLLSNHFHFYWQFQADCQRGQLPSYSFIEPQYYSDMAHPENDQHPPSVVTLGEQLIADVYNRLRSSKLWIKTLLIVTHDEHGGCYDHVPPPSAFMKSIKFERR